MVYIIINLYFYCVFFHFGWWNRFFKDCRTGKYLEKKNYIWKIQIEYYYLCGPAPVYIPKPLREKDNVFHLRALNKLRLVFPLNFIAGSTFLRTKVYETTLSHKFQRCDAIA